MKAPISIYIIGLFVLVATSCKKKDDIDMLYAIPAPVELKVEDLKARKATIGWTYDQQDATSFSVELSTSETFAAAGLVKKVEIDASAERTVMFDSLASLTPYFVRVQAKNGDPLFSSAFSSMAFTSAEIESVFNSINRADITINSVVLTWRAPVKGSVTHLTLTPAGGPPQDEIVLSSVNIADQRIAISDLRPATTYLATIYDGEENKGEISFATLDPDAIITINTGTVAYETLQDAIFAAVSGDIINVGSATYDFSGGENIDIQDKSLTIRGLPGKKVPELKSKIINLKGNVTYLKLSGLKLIGVSAQTIGISELTSESDISIENCDLSGSTAGLIYASTSTTSAASVSLTIDNSLFHDFGATGGDFIDFRGGTVKKISVKNSSFWNLARAFLRIDASSDATSSEPLNFDNCTFNNLCNGGKFVYVRSPGAKVTFNKCIITNMVSNQDNGVSGTGTLLTFNQCNIYGSNSKNIRSVGKNNETTEIDPQYQGASAGDFTVGNASVKGAGQGDPRWLK